MLSVQIHKRLKLFDINLSFTCGASQILAIVGPSGAGKTTILRTVAGLERPNNGCITFNNTSWFDRDRKINVSPQKRKVGYVSQGYGLFPHLNVEENIAFAAKSTEKVSQLMDLMGIAVLAQSRTEQISGGERQRVAFAQALATEPDIMLLDEPFSALDYRTKKKLRHQLIDMKKLLGLPILMVTHDLEDAISLTDCILPVMNGSFAPEWLPDTLQYAVSLPSPDKATITPGRSKSLPIQISIPAGCSP